MVDMLKTTYVRLAAVANTALVVASSCAAKSLLQVWGCHPHDWIVRSTPAQDVAPVLRLWQALNEHENAAFVVTNTGTVDAEVRLDISCPGMTEQSTGSLLLYRIVEIRPDPAVSPGCDTDYKNSGKPLPEVLDPVTGPILVRAGESQQIWFTCSSAGVTPGTYEGHVSVAGLDERRNVPLAVTVWPITLPTRTALAFFTWECLPGPPALARAYGEMLRAHYVNMCWLEGPRVGDDGSVSRDAYDWQARALIGRELGFTPVLKSVRLAHLEPVYAEMARLGIDTFYHYMYDEPKPEKKDAMIHAYRAMRKASANVRIFRAFNEGAWQPGNRLGLMRAMIPYTDAWLSTRGGQYCDIFSTSRWKGYPDVFELFSTQQARGVPIWYYHNSWRAANHPGGTLAWTRSDGWYIWYHGIDGVMPGCMGHTRHETVPLPRAAKPAYSVPIERQSYINNGYVRKTSDDGYQVLSCKRLSGWRDGLADHMLLTLLDHLIENARRASLTTRAENATQILESAYAEVKRCFRSWPVYTEQRRRLAQTIVRLQEAGCKAPIERGIMPRTRPYRFEEKTGKVSQDIIRTYTRPSANLLRNGSFEAGRTGWDQDLGKAAARSRKHAATGVWSARFERGPDSSRAFRHDWVRADFWSDPVPVARGQLVRLSTKVLVPETITNTDRGVVIALAGYTDGEAMHSYAAPEFESRCFEKTDGWKTVTTHLFVDDPPCDSVRARIGFCGAGTAYVDDVSVVVLDKP